MVRHPSRYSLPASVNCSLLVERLINFTLRCASRTLTLRVTAAGDIPSCVAASVKLPRSTTRQNTRCCYLIHFRPGLSLFPLVHWRRAMSRSPPHHAQLPK